MDTNTADDVVDTVAPDLRTLARSVAAPGIAVLVAFPLLKFAIHLFAGAGYGYHRDEMYYLICADHLDWGYVDHPALSVLLLAATRAVVGSSPDAIRLVPGACGALTVLLVGLMTRRLGGGLFAQAVAMLAATVAPFYLALDGFYSMNAIDLLVWAAAAWIVMRICDGESPRWWWVLGVVVGLGAETKISAVWLAGSIGVGVLLTDRRQLLRTRDPWIGAAIVAVMLVPYAAWQFTHRFATVEFVREAASSKLVAVSIGRFFNEEAAGMVKQAAPIWMAGLVYYFLPEGRRYRMLGWMWIAVFTLLAATAGKRAAYLAPAFTWLLASGSVLVERWCARFGAAVRVAALALLVVAGANAAVFVLPVVAPATLEAYAAPIAAVHAREERGAAGALPEFLSHMAGWDELLATLQPVYERLPPDERTRTAFLAPNYGIASAINVLGRARGLPESYSGHNNYWFWGPPDPRRTTLVVIGMKTEDVHRLFADVTLAAVTVCHFCAPFETARPVWIAREPRVPLADVWPRLHLFN